MSNFMLLVICLLAGVVLRKTRRLPRETPLVLNQFIFHISMPAVVLLQLHQVELSWDSLKISSMAWVYFGMTYWVFACAFQGFGRGLGHWDRKTLGALILTTALANTSFVGFPLLETLWGPSSLKTAVLYDQLGSFPVLSTLGILVASFYSAKKSSLRDMVRRILFFPPLYALVLGLVLRPVPFPDFVTEFLARLGAMLSPLALVSTGFQLRINARVLTKYASPLTLGLLFKLVVGPLILVGIYLGIFRWGGEIAQVSLVESAMAPMITAAVLVTEYELNSELANLMVGIGIPLSFLTVPIWVHIFRSGVG